MGCGGEARSEQECRDPCQQAGPEGKEKFMESGAAWGGLYWNCWNSTHRARAENLPFPPPGSRRHENELLHGREVEVEWHQMSEAFPWGLDWALIRYKLLCEELAWRNRLQWSLTPVSLPSHPEQCRVALETMMCGQRLRAAKMLLTVGRYSPS